MATSFKRYIHEDTTGALSMVRPMPDKLNNIEASVKTQSRLIPRTIGTAPNHWAFSKSFSGSKYGANPKLGALSYDDFIKTEEEYDSVDEQDTQLNIPDKFKTERDAITNLKNDIVQTEQKLAADKARLNNMTNDLQNKMAADRAAAQNTQIAAQSKPQPTTM